MKHNCLWKKEHVISLIYRNITSAFQTCATSSLFKATEHVTPFMIILNVKAAISLLALLSLRDVAKLGI
jgi:hypothetical protein